MSENMRVQSELNTTVEVYRLKGEMLALREQNRVLRSNLVNCAARLEAYYGEDYPAVRDAKAALTATSQPQRPRCEQCGRLLIHEPHDPTCLYLRPATSQEGQG